MDCPTDISYGDCYGCYACEEICPKNAIEMTTDSEGFLYPVTDYNRCINCGLCQKICIRNTPNHIEYPKTFPRTYAAMNKDEDIRMGSSSGGIFPELSRYFIEELHGAVVGVRWSDNMETVADIAETMEDVQKFYGSKYVKSNFSGIKKRVKTLLEDGRYVLYTGLPCECASLRAYLRKDYERLLICEILCHSAPSPLVWRKYLDYLEEKHGSKVVNYVFRNKEKGWLSVDSTTVITFENGKELKVRTGRNSYFRNFYKNHTNRVSCTRCTYVRVKRSGDITLGDFWGIRDAHPELFDNKGISMVMVNNQQGAKFWAKVRDNFTFQKSTVPNGFIKNHKKPSPHTPERDEFFNRMSSESINLLLDEYNDLLKKD